MAVRDRGRQVLAVGGRLGSWNLDWATPRWHSLGGSRESLAALGLFLEGERLSRASVLETHVMETHVGMCLDVVALSFENQRLHKH